MTIASVTGGDIIDPVWGNSVADSLNDTVENIWLTFTPTWTNVGMTGAWKYLVTHGGVWLSGTSTVSVIPTSTLEIDLSAVPFPIVGQTSYAGNAYMNDVSAGARYQCMTQLFASDRLRFIFNTDSVVSGIVNATSPFTWAVGDTIGVSVFIPIL